MTRLAPPKIRGVVFDLDDTLIDTTGQLLIPAHSEAAAAMISAGLPGSLEEVARKRLDLSRARPRESVDLLVARFYGVDDHAIVTAGHEAFYNRAVRRLEPFEDAIAVLESLAEDHIVCLCVTAGHPETQQRKLSLTGLAAHLTTVCVVPPGDSKEEAIAELMREHDLTPEATVVIGDRIDREIAAARRLGCWAVRVDHGEGRFARPEVPDEQPHYTVPGVIALRAVIDDIEENAGG
jgi:FMN phosphatase YigB (HAD superfamily)